MDRIDELTDQLIHQLDLHPHMRQDNMSANMRGEASVMRLLGATQTPISAGELSSRLNMRTSRIAAVLNALERKGIIVRGTDGQDRRRVMVSLTPEGERIHMERSTEHRACILQILTALGERDAEDFVRVLTRLLDILPELDRQRDAERE